MVNSFSLRTNLQDSPPPCQIRIVARLPMNFLGTPASHRPVESRKPELAGGTPALPGIVFRFRATMRVQSWRSHLSMNLVAADVNPLHLIQSKVRADSRRLLRFRGSKHEFIREFSLRSVETHFVDGRGMTYGTAEIAMRTKRTPAAVNVSRCRAPRNVFSRSSQSVSQRVPSVEPSTKNY